MKKRVYQLLNKHSDEDILKRLFVKYPDQERSRDGYALILKKLRSIAPINSENIIKCQKFGCSFLKPEDNTSWAFGIISWAEVMGSLVNKSDIDFLCNLLFELTFYGFSEEEHNDAMNEVFNLAREAKEIFAEEKE